MPGTDLHAYYARKRSMALVSILLGAVAWIALFPVSRVGSIAVVAGTTCGLLNALLVMRGNERLANHRSVALFVLGSVLRISVFGIVPVVFALHGPWWTMPAYFLAFFMPLASYAIAAAVTIRTGSPS